MPPSRVLLSVVSVGSLIGALATARRTVTSVHHVVVGAFAFGVSMLVFAAAPTLAFALPIAVVMGFASMMFMVTSTAIVQMRADPVMRGRVLALQADRVPGHHARSADPSWAPSVMPTGPRAGLVIGGLSGLAAGPGGSTPAPAARPATGSRPARPDPEHVVVDVDVDVDVVGDGAGG